MVHTLVWWLLLLPTLGFKQSLVFGKDHECNRYEVCLPGAEDIAVSPRKVTASNTCGNPAGKYCELNRQDSCSTCDSSSPVNRHPADFMIDRNDTSWWQSQTWWEWFNIHKEDPLRVNITLSFNKSYIITGEIRVQFKSVKPSKMLMEKSTDYGNTWIPLQYFADNCNSRYNMMPSSLNCSADTVLCTEKYKDRSPGTLSFSFLSCYTKESFWDGKTQNLTNATDLRLRLEVPGTNGREITKQENYLNQYFYAISNIQVFGRCQCNGHAPYCKFATLNGGRDYVNTPECDCQHNTMGVDCEKCQPLYNNKKWMPATSSTEPNPCEKCQCHEHATSCTYNSSLGHGVCDSCRHNTTGYFCEQCKDKFYRNFSRNLNDSDVCVDCDCALEGVTNTGSCSQDLVVIGQCMCKDNVTGRRCDRCNDTYYGYDLHPVGSCLECDCNMNGTEHGSLNCNQTTGQCACKPNIHHRTCSTCKVGFYKFPNVVQDDCLKCACDSGGSAEEICETTLGKCLCRDGIQGENCSDVAKNRFFPKFDYFLFEAEYQSGNYNLTSNNSLFEKYFTGRGYARITGSQYIIFNVSVTVDGNYSLVLRHAKALADLKVRVQGSAVRSCPYINKTVLASRLTSNYQGISWISDETSMFCSQNNYSVHVYGHDPVTNFSINIDSLVLIPQLTHLRAYRENRNLVDMCRTNYTTIQGGIMSSLSCRNVTFSTMVELLNGSLACECSQIGSENETCDPYGGQCFCKPGVMGRTCHRCQPGYYNFTENGCTPCNCNHIGTKESSVCDPESGQCSCKLAVEGRACTHCKIDHFGLNTGKGCEPCSCNATGSRNGTNGTCDAVTGKCFCKNGVEDKSQEDKCDRCKANFFNFTEVGCQACDCDHSGSSSQQCNSSGECPCKSNTNGKKCDRCRNGTFGLEESNPSGCTPCFCFNRTGQCSSAEGFVLTAITQSNVSLQPDGYVRLHPNFNGNQLHSYGRLFEVESLEAAKESYSFFLQLKGSRGNASFILKHSQCPQRRKGRYCTQLHENEARNISRAYEMQSILVDLKEVALGVTGMLSSRKRSNVTYLNVSMGSANRSHGSDDVKANHVEHCTCPKNYASLSCGNCNSGFTREIANSSLFESCYPCSCNNRSDECDPETGICKNCSLSVGDFCEECAHGLDIATGCTRCLPGFWNKTRYGCEACNCILNNTVNHNSSECNVISGQCSCKTYVGGERCQHCADNYFNTSYGCRECPECYGLIQSHVQILKKMINNSDEMVKELNQELGSVGKKKFGQRLYNARNKVMNLFKEANSVVNGGAEDLNNSLNALNELSSNISYLLVDVNVTSNYLRTWEVLTSEEGTWTKGAYILLQNVDNMSSPLVADLSTKVQLFLSPVDSQKSNLNETKKTLWDVSQNISNESEDTLKVVKDARDSISLSDIKSTLEQQNRSHFNLRYINNFCSNHSRIVNNVLFSSSTILKTAEELTMLVEKNENRSDILRAFNQTVEYSALEKNASSHVELAANQRVVSNQTLENSSALLANATRIYNESNQAKESAETTLRDAKKTLDSFHEFQNRSHNAEQQASHSLEKIDAINDNSSNFVKNIMNVSQAVEETLNSTDDAIKLAERANILSSTENQNVTSLYKWNKLFPRRQVTELCSSDLMENYMENITRRSNSLTSLTSCANYVKENATNLTVSAVSETTTTRRIVADFNEEVSRINQAILESVDDVNNTQVAQMAALLEEKIQGQKRSFGYLQEVIHNLRQDEKDKNEYIKQLRSKVKALKSKVEDLESLRNSISNIPSCGNT